MPHTYFARVNSNEEYNPQHHSRDDVAIFHLEIQEKEGTYPQATLLIRNPDVDFSTKEEAIISRNNTILFRGQLMKTPIKGEKNLIQIKLVAKPQNAREQLEKLCTFLKKEGGWDLLFVSDENETRPYEALEGRTQLFYWDRATGRVNATDIFKGDKAIPLPNDSLFDTIRYRVAHRPLQSVHMQVIAEWIQSRQGEEDIGYLLKFRFPEGIVNTLTGDILQTNWWRVGDKDASGSYTILDSALEEFTPPSTGILNLYPRTSIPLTEELIENSPPYFLKRSWFHVRGLRVKWHYKQKRREIFHIHLGQTLQDINVEPKTKSLKIRLQNIGGLRGIPRWLPHHGYSKRFQVQWEGILYYCLENHLSKTEFEPSKWEKVRGNTLPTLETATFFNTERGKQAALHALEIAKSHLAYSSRAIEIKLSGTFDEMAKLTCAHRVALKDAPLPWKKITGKVKQVRLIKDGSTGVSWGEAILACSIGTKKKKFLPSQEKNPYVDEEYVIDTYIFIPQQEIMSPSSIAYRSWEDQSPSLGITSLGALSARDLVEEITVLNPPDEQNKALSEVASQGREKALSVLRNCPTRIRIRFKDLRPIGTLEHHIHLPIAEGYAPPHQLIK